jgi:hypothetical protein
MRRWWWSVFLLLLSSSGAWPIQATIHYREPTASGTLKHCLVTYCTAIGTCTPSTNVVPGSVTNSDDGNGGDDHASGGNCSGGCEYSPLTVNVPIKPTHTHACFAVLCIETNGNETPASTVMCCTGGTCS